MPGRLGAFLPAMRDHDMNMASLAGVRWGVVRAVGELGILCPDRPASHLCIPLNRTTALVAGYPNVAVGNDTIEGLNRSLYEQSRDCIFGTVEDVRTFAAGLSG